MKLDIEKVKFDDKGLIAAIAQDEKTGEIAVNITKAKKTAVAKKKTE